MSKFPGQTGPKSHKGKRISSMNALKSGVFARSPVLPFEDANAHRRHVKSIIDSLEPENTLERNLAEEIANSMWRGTRLQLNEIVQQDDIFNQLTTVNLAQMLGVNEERAANAPHYLKDMKQKFPQKLRNDFKLAYQQYEHLIANSQGIKNYQMVWSAYKRLFILLDEWMFERYEHPLFLSTRAGLEMVWQQNPKQLEEVIKKFSYFLWWAIHFEEFKPQIRHWMSTWYFLHSQSRSKISSIQEQASKERKIYQSLMDSYMRLRKNRIDHFLFQVKFEDTCEENAPGIVDKARANASSNPNLNPTAKAEAKTIADAVTLTKTETETETETHSDSDRGSKSVDRKNEMPETQVKSIT